MSRFGRQPLKHGYVTHLSRVTCHVYRRKFNIRTQCKCDEKYVNLKRKVYRFHGTIWYMPIYITYQSNSTAKHVTHNMLSNIHISPTYSVAWCKKFFLLRYFSLLLTVFWPRRPGWDLLYYEIKHLCKVSATPPLSCVHFSLQLEWRCQQLEQH